MRIRMSSVPGRFLPPPPPALPDPSSHIHDPVSSILTPYCERVVNTRSRPRAAPTSGIELRLNVVPPAMRMRMIGSSVDSLGCVDRSDCRAEANSWFRRSGSSTGALAACREGGGDWLALPLDLLDRDRDRDLLRRLCFLLLLLDLLFRFLSRFLWSFLLLLLRFLAFLCSSRSPLRLFLLFLLRSSSSSSEERDDDVEEEDEDEWYERSSRDRSCSRSRLCLCRRRSFSLRSSSLSSRRLRFLLLLDFFLSVLPPPPLERCWSRWSVMVGWLNEKWCAGWNDSALI